MSDNDPSGWGPAPEPGSSAAPPPPPAPGTGWSPSEPPPPPQGAWGQPPQQGWGQPQPGGYAPPASTESTAIVSLVLACLSWPFCPVILAVVALVLVPSSRSKMEASGGRLTGEGLLTASKIIAWLNIALWGLLIVFFILFVMVGTVSSTTTSY